MKRIKDKIKAGETEEITEAEKAPRKSAEVIDLMTALKKSVEHKPKARKRRAA